MRQFELVSKNTFLSIKKTNVKINVTANIFATEHKAINE